MSELEWSQILREQSQHINEDDRIQLERKQKLKQLYKKQLQRLIKYQQNHADDEKISDYRIVKQAARRQQAKMEAEQTDNQRKQHQKAQMSMLNRSQIQKKKQKQEEQSKKIREFYQDRMSKMNTQIQEQKQQKMKYKQLQKNNLSKSYQKQIREKRNKELCQKLQDEKYVRLMEEVQARKEQNRNYYINKMRNYKQNPEVYQLAKVMADKKQRQKMEYIRKLQKEQPTSFLEQQQPKIRSEKQKIKKIIETSNFNRIYFENKSTQSRLYHQKQTEEYATINKSIEFKANCEKEHHLKEVQNRKNMLRNELDRQIGEYQHKNRRRNTLDQHQSRINRSGNIPALPGLVKDYSNQKKFKILQTFLGGSTKTFSPYF